MKSVVHFVVIVLLSLYAAQSSSAQELAAVTPGMALELQLHDIRLDPKPLLVAQKVGKSKVDEPKKPKENKASKKKSAADKNDTDGDDTTEPVSTQSSAKPTAKPAAKSAAKAGLQQFAGNASWYGVPFHGRKTASGEIFDMYKCSAAHKSLPMVSRVLVEDPRTGNTVLVRVNDRGPFVKARVMDLSREAARKLGTMGRGVYYIEATVLGK